MVKKLQSLLHSNQKESIVDKLYYYAKQNIYFFILNSTLRVLFFLFCLYLTILHIDRYR